MAFCASCGAQMAEGATFCGACGAAVGAAAPGVTAPPPAAPVAASAGGLEPNIAGALAYVTLLPAIIFLVIEPYNKDRFVRFHAFQSIFFGVAWIVLIIGMMILGIILALIPVLGWILDILLWFIIGLGGFVLWIILVYKAYNKEQFMLPVIGKLAEQQASK